MGSRAGCQRLGCTGAVSNWKRCSETGLLRLFHAPGHGSGRAEYDMDTRWQIRLFEVCDLDLCNSPAARADIADYTERRVCLKGSRGGRAWRAVSVGKRRVSRPQSLHLRICESIDAAQHLSGSRSVSKGSGTLKPASCRPPARTFR